MFEDDLDIDEILSTSESSNSLKRFSTDFHNENLNKKPKINTLPTPEDVEATKQTSGKKLFRFKKKVIVPNESSTDAGKLHVIDIIPSPTKKITPESSRNVKKEIVSNNTNLTTTVQRANLTQSKTHQKAESSRLTEDCDSISRSNCEYLNHNSKNVNPYVEPSVLRRTQSDRNICKRRFPGPAGILPERSVSNSSLETFDDSSRVETKDEICSQTSFIHFNEKPWEEMMVDFRTQHISLPNKYNIQWIKSRTMAKRLINQKAPFLAAFVDSIRSHSIQNPIVNLVLKDKTGTIQGTILHNLYEEHTSSLTVGSVVVLKEIGVLNTGPNEEPYLTITQNNLVSIYTNKKKTTDGSTQLSGEVSITVLQNLGAENILNRINETKNLHKLTETKKNVPSVSLMNRDVMGPKNLNDTFRKVVKDVKTSGTSTTPNLSVLKIKSAPIGWSTNITNENGSSMGDNVKAKENIDDIKDLFESNEDLDEFFNDTPPFCSTQKQTFEDRNENKSMEGKMETCNGDNREKSRIFEDIFEGVDANALFDEF